MPQKAVNLKRGDALIVQLSSNRTTGYSWSSVFSKVGILKKDGDVVYRQNSRNSGILGAGGLEIWNFRADHIGSTQIFFCYARPWEKGIPPERHINWDVTVHN